MVFYNLLEEKERIVTTKYTSTKQQEAFTCRLAEPGATKMLVNIDYKSVLEPEIGNEILLTADPEGKEWITHFDQSLVKKGLGFHNVFKDEVFVHYPAKISNAYQIDLANEDRKIVRMNSSYDKAYHPENHCLPVGYTLLDIQKTNMWDQKEIYLMTKGTGVDLSIQNKESLTEPSNQVLFSIRSDREKIEPYNDHATFK
jgi:hypothetical protein